MTIERRKRTTVKVVITNSPIYKLTSLTTDHQTNLPQTCPITVIEECMTEFYCSVIESHKQLSEHKKYLRLEPTYCFSTLRITLVNLYLILKILIMHS